MARPKSDNFVGFKCPTELREDALVLAALGGKTEAEIWKEAMEFKLAFVSMVRLGYWDIRAFSSNKKVQQGLTTEGKVQPC